MARVIEGGGKNVRLGCCHLWMTPYHWVKGPLHDHFRLCQSCIDGQIIESPILMSGFKAGPSTSAISDFKVNIVVKMFSLLLSTLLERNYCRNVIVHWYSLCSNFPEINKENLLKLILCIFRLSLVH